LRPMFRRFHVNPFDLLGQGEDCPVAIALPGDGEPKLSIAWNSFHQNFFGELAAFFQWARMPRGTPAADLLRDCRIERRIPMRAIAAAGLWHIVVFILPWPQLPGGARRDPAFDDTQVTWSGPIDDLPLLNVPKAKPRAPNAKVAEEEPLPEATDVFHPRQRIFTDPVRPSHPRQTLVQPADPMEPPKFLPPLPNMVRLAASAAPARPRLEISEQALEKLRPREVKRAATTDVPAPDVPNMEMRPAEVSIITVADGPARPKLEINAGSAPRIVAHRQNGEVVAVPDLMGASSDPSGGASATIIALSATPAPPAPVVEVPKGNLAARVAISPEGKGTGTGGASDSSTGYGDGRSSIGISISGGSPKPNAGTSGLSGAARLRLPKVQAIYERPDPAAADDPPERTGPPNFGALPPGSPPEQVFSSRRIYSMNVNMPNLNSVTGSWIIHFSELHLTGGAKPTGEVSAPVPLRKVDPKYPQDAIREHVEGEVILYGVIRPDGTADSIQIVHGIDPQLDANAVAAFAQWKFQPATKGGQPVALEAIVHIPFRGPARQ